MPKLHTKTILGFAIGDLGGNLYFSIIGFILIFYLTESLGISGTLAGSVMMIGKFWDAITDPIVSSLSDRSKSRFGRRRPFIFFGALLLSISFIAMFSLPNFESTTATFIVAVILFCLLSTAYTFVNIPYAAMQPELTDDYHEKTRLTGYRMAFAILGTLMAVGARPLADAFGLERGGWTKMAAIMGLFMLISSWITVFTVKEPVGKKYKKQRGVITSYKEAIFNKEFTTALIPWALFITAITIIQGSYLYYFKYLFKAQYLFDITLLGLILVSLLSLPLWVKISKRVSKGRCYQLGMSLIIIALLLSSIFAPLTTPLFTVIAISVAGFGFSTHYIMPHSIIPDIIELDAARTGIRREGVYISIWNFLMKSGQAFAGLLIGVTLDLFNYIPPNSSGLEVEQSDLTIRGISILCGPLPILFIILGVILLKRYPISHSYYERELRKEERINETY